MELGTPFVRPLNIPTRTVHLYITVERCEEYMSILGFPAQQRENGPESPTSRLHGKLPDCTGLETWPQGRSYSQDSQTPVTKKGIGRLNTTVNYLATCKFLLNLSQVMEPLRGLTQKGIEWYWSKAGERAFTEVKQLVIQAPVLTYMY